MSETTQNPQLSQDRSRFGALGAGVWPTGVGIDVARGGPHAWNYDRIALVNVPLAIVKSVNYASQLLFTFPQGRIAILSALGAVNFTVTSGAGTIVNPTTGTFGVGTSAASSTSLTGTAVNLLPVTSVSTGAQNVASSTYTPVMAALGTTMFDGTATATAAYLNLSLATTAADGAVVVNGYVVLGWQFCGDL